MVHLDLDSSSAKFLLEILELDLANLVTEISKTDNRDFKDSLKNRRENLESILNNLRGQVSPDQFMKTDSHREATKTRMEGAL